MSCRRYERTIALSVSGDLSPRREADLQRHLASCADCRAAEAAMRHTHAALLALPDIANDATLDARVFDAISRIDAAKSPKPRVMTSPRFAAAALTVVALTATSVWWRNADRASVTPISVAAYDLNNQPSTPQSGTTPQFHLSDLLPPLTGEKQEVIKMYTDDPKVVFYLVADARGVKTP